MVAMEELHLSFQILIRLTMYSERHMHSAKIIQLERSYPLFSSRGIDGFGRKLSKAGGGSRRGIYNQKYPFSIGKASPSISDASLQESLTPVFPFWRYKTGRNKILSTPTQTSSTKLPTPVPKHSYSCLQVVALVLKKTTVSTHKRSLVHLPFSRSLSDSIPLYISISIPTNHINFCHTWSPAFWMQKNSCDSTRCQIQGNFSLENVQQCFTSVQCSKLLEPDRNKLTQSAVS